jgi:hypothetical protein
MFVVAALTVRGHRARFGISSASLALGAFVAGVVVSESPFSHQISADLLPFREAFAVIFFVSVGMLVDPRLFVTTGTGAAHHAADRRVKGNLRLISFISVSGAHRARHRRGTRPDRRVLVHPRPGWPVAGPRRDPLADLAGALVSITLNRSCCGW